MSVRSLLRIDGLPTLQNRTYATREAALACTVGDFELVQDDLTGLVFNRRFDPALLRYDAEYQNEQAHSPTFLRHLEAVCGIIDRHFAGCRLAEIGCGKGYFLEMLVARGHDITGVDPAYEGSNPRVLRAPFERSLGLDAEALVLRHVLEHIGEPVSFLEGIAEANGGRGLIYIEVPCLDWILSRRAWFDFFYEHVNYFRLDDFNRLFGRVVEAGRLFGDQYLYVVADLATLRRPASGAQLTIPENLFGRLQVAASHRGDGSRRAAIWGAASKGVLFAVHLQRTGALPAFAIDLNPAKQGRYLPLTGLPVLSPDTAIRTLEVGERVYVMNSNYLDEIQGQSGHRFEYVTIDDE